MNFNYSYRAFVISCLLVGNLVLLMVSVDLKKKAPPVEDILPIEYAELIPETELEETPSEKIKIETNTAYNEAEQFIKELENSRNEAETYSEENAISPAESKMAPNDMALADAQNQLDQVKERLSQKAAALQNKKAGASINRKTTISYRLNNRKSLELPNPVYICDRGGKIVVNIEVNALGRVLKANYNKALSSTTNGCLIDSALEYAYHAKFTTKASLAKQRGTITYSFPGQQ